VKTGRKKFFMTYHWIFYTGNSNDAVKNVKNKVFVTFHWFSLENGTVR